MQLYIKRRTDNTINKLPHVLQIVTQDDTNFNVDAPTAGEFLHGAEEQQNMSYTCGIKARRYAKDKIIRCILKGPSA
jgi:hypothetical protein